jgi:hypothetical protein
MGDPHLQPRHLPPLRHLTPTGEPPARPGRHPIATPIITDRELPRDRSRSPFIRGKSLGKPTTGNELSSDDLETLARDTLATAIAHREDVLTAYWSGLEPELRYRTDLGEARVTRIRQQRRYERGDEAVTLVDADWDLDVHPGFQDTDTGEPALWSRFADSTRLHARIQLFVSESEDSPVGVEFISGRWWSRESIFRTSSGAFMTITGVPPEGEDEIEEGDNERGSTGAGEADSGRG